MKKLLSVIFIVGLGALVFSEFRRAKEKAKNVSIKIK